MIHRHHIIPKHMGGTDDPDNIIELTVEEHALAHLELYEKYGKKEDLCAYYMLSGKNKEPEFVQARASLGGKASYKKRISKGIDHLPFFGSDLTDERKFEISSSGGKVQGKINAESGHMKRIQKLGDKVKNGRLGGEATIRSGKGAFGDPEQRVKVAKLGGKVQGKINAESGHLKNISKDYWNKVKSGEIERPKRTWYTDGRESVLVQEGDTPPDGFYKGRKIKNV